MSLLPLASPAPAARVPAPAVEEAESRAQARSWQRLLALPLALQLLAALLAQRDRVYLDDEVGTWRAAGEGFGALVTHFTEWQTQPAYLLLAKASALVLGRTEFALRLPALLAGLGLTLAVFALARRLVDARAGFAAASLVALHPYVVFYTQMARGYTLAMALTVLSLWCVERLARGAGGRWTSVVGTLARAGSVYTHLGACASVIAEVLLARHAARGGDPASRRGRLGRALVPVLLGGLLSIALYLPLLADMRAFRERWTGAELGGFTVWVLPLVARVWGGGNLLGMGVLAGLVLLGLAALLRAPARRGAALVLGAWTLGIAGFYVALDTACYPWAFARFLLPMLPGVLLIAGVGLAALAARRAGRPRAALGIALVLVAGLAYRDLVPLALGPKDLVWPRFLDAFAAESEGARTLVLAPVRFQALEPYLGRPGTERIRMLRIEELTRSLKREGAAALLATPLTVLQDVVPVEGLAGFEVTRLGSSTRLDLATPAGDERAALEALRALAEKQIECLEPLERRPFAGPWVYWRLDLRHEHPAFATLSHAAAHALLGATSALLGDAELARRAAERASALRDSVPLPGEVFSRF